MADIDTLIAELRAGLEGTTQGGWTRHEKGIHPHPFVCGAPERLEHGEESFVVAYLVGTNVEANARHIALASPQNIRALLDHIESSGREMDALMAERAEFKRRAEAAETKPDLLQGECDAKRNIIASLEAELARLRAPVGEGEVGRMVAALNDLSEYVFQQPPVDYEEAAAKAMKTAAELLQRLAAPVTEGEVKGVVRSLSLIACAPRCEHASECNCTVLDNAADLIQRLAAPVTEGEVGEVVKRLRELSKAVPTAGFRAPSYPGPSPAATAAVSRGGFGATGASIATTSAS